MRVGLCVSFGAALLSACLRQDAPEPLQTEQGSPTEAATPGPTEGPLPTATPVHEVLFVERCASEIEGLPEDSQGSLAVDSNGQLILMGMPGGEVISILAGSDRYVYISGQFPLVSPAGRYLAFIEGPASPSDKPQLLHIVDALGNELVTPMWLDGWDVVTGWLGEGAIEMSFDAEPDGTMAKFSTATLSEVILRPTFLDIVSLPGPDWYRRSAVALYDPTTTRAAYVATEPAGVYFRLWDAANRLELWRSPILAWAVDPPAWSPDGDRVAFDVIPARRIQNLSSRLTLVSREGLVQATYDMSAAAHHDSEVIEAIWPSWAPGGERIAVWIARSGGDSASLPTLGVLDLGTSQLTDYCIGGAGPRLPIWSPDGRFIVTRTHMVDTVEARAFPLQESWVPVGWLAPVK